MQDKLKGQWSQLKGKIKEEWAEFSNDDLDKISGNKDKLLGKLQELYGYTKQEAEAAWDEFYSKSLQALELAKEETSSVGQNASSHVNNFVQQSPWKALAIAAVAGLVVGLRI